MASSFDTAGGHEAWYAISQDGNTTVTIRSSVPLKPRAIYTGSSVLTFYWVKGGKGSYTWHFTPTLFNQREVQYIEGADEGQRQIINVQ